MTLQTVLKSGKPFKRPNHSMFFSKVVDSGSTTRLVCTDGLHYLLFAEDILADDWIVKTEPIVVECQWIWSKTDFHVFPHGADGAPKSFSWREMEGKRTRLTIEVLD